MNIQKYIIIIIFSFLPILNFAQGKTEFECENGFETIETEVESQKTVSYKIISSQKLYTKESFEFSEGIIVISDLNDKLNSKEIIKTIATIGLKNNLSKMIVFKTCEAVKVYFQVQKSTSEQKDYLEKHLIAKVNLDLYKTLSRKEKKRNRRKRELIELVSKETCEEFKNLKTKKISAEEIGSVMSKNSVQYVEKIEKTYRMSFEESTLKFLEDLTNHIIIHCEPLKELVNKQN